MGKKRYARLARLVWYYPGFIKFSDLNAVGPEERASIIEGLLLNIPRLEAAEDLRNVMATGAAFSDTNDSKYIDNLFDMAWEDDTETAEEGKQQVRIAKAQRDVGKQRTP